MGRELKRVPLDFDWPLNKTWLGYVCPYRSVKCCYCDETGLNPETAKISDAFYAHKGVGERWAHRITLDELQALLDADRLWGFWRPTIPGKGWDPDAKPPKASQELLDRVNAANAPQSRAFLMGHDAINRWVLIKARAKRLGVYGECKQCKGDGSLWYSPKIKKLAARWKGRGPPKGPGFQLWETVSEGSPVSPVFPTAEEFAAWLVSQGYSPEAATAFIGSGWVPSMVLANGQLLENVEAARASRSTPSAEPKENE
jgi:hypothetical protein